MRCNCVGLLSGDVRVAFLFERYQQLISLLPVTAKKTTRKRKAKQDDVGG